jgi:organic radical activating enzyme
VVNPSSPKLDPRLVIELHQRLGEAARGAVVTVSPPPGGLRGSQLPVLRAWCGAAGHVVLELSPNRIRVRRGPVADPFADIPGEQRPGTRVWLYTNFDCNLACDYCCVRSSPQTPRAALGTERVAQVAREAAAAGVEQLILTGGEPFLLNDIAELANACTQQLPTLLLTNGMLFRGVRLDRLRTMDRARLTLQISLDSATAELHDSHRGHRSWDRAVAGIRLAKEEGFRVRVAATITSERLEEARTLRRFLDGLGIPRSDQIVRTLAHRGFADEGVELSVASVIPEVTVTASGIYWHPVGATDPDFLVTPEIFPLHQAITLVRDRFVEIRAQADTAAAHFPCA